MKTEVSTAVNELRAQFQPSEVIAREDGEGGAYIIIENVFIGNVLTPSRSWVGFHISALYPYADIYPLFIDGKLSRADGAALQAPLSVGHAFESRQAIQVSRRNSTATNAGMKAVFKVTSVINYLEKQA